MHRSFASVPFLILGVLTVPPPLSGQVEVETTPMLGMYIPLGLLVDEHDAEAAAPLRKRHIGTLLVGVRSALRFGTVSALEVSVAYSPSMVAVTDARSTVDRGGGVLLGSVRLPLTLNATTEAGSWRFHVAPGAGIVSRYGEVWADYGGTTDLALVLAGGARLTSRRSPIDFRIEIEDYLSWAGFHRADAASATRPRLHHDLLWSLGISIPVGRR